MKRTGIMGGTFNPIHYGHLLAAEMVKEELQLDEILFMPSGNPPHKNSKEVLDSEHRVEMLKLAIAHNSHFSLDLLEIDRQGKTYTYDTLIELHKLHYGNKFYFIIGFDTLKELASWKNIEMVAQLCCFAVVNRSNTAMEMREESQRIIQHFQLKAVFVDMPDIELSSTDIRNRISSGKSIRYMVPDSVLDYMTRYGLYQQMR